jgi:hypothetical protein
MKTTEWIGNIENEGEKTGTARIFRACVAVGRESTDLEFRKRIISIGEKYHNTKSKDLLNILLDICNKLENSNGELREAYKALKFAIEDVTK